MYHQLHQAHQVHQATLMHQQLRLFSVTICITHQAQPFHQFHQVQGQTHCEQQQPGHQFVHHFQPLHQTLHTERIHQILQKHLALIFNECNVDTQSHHCHQSHKQAIAERE